MTRPSAPANASGPTAAPSPAGPSARARSPRQAKPWQLGYLYFLWFVILFDPQWWLADLGPRFVLKLPTVLFALMLLLVLSRVPRSWYPPLLAVLLFMAGTVPLAYVKGVALAPTKALFAYYVLALATITFVRTARQAMPIVLGVMLYQYVWWVVLGASRGLVPWHPAYANYDSYGPLMCIGIASCYFFALAIRGRLRWLSFATVAGCTVGLVSSYARGAVLAGGAVLVWTWVRSKHKGVTTVALAFATVVVIVAGNFFSGGHRRGDAKRNFWAEMASVTDTGGTRQARAELWRLAWRVYLEHPAIGVGAENFGPYAADNFGLGDTGSRRFDENPLQLWGKKLHSTYFQVISEFGTIGTLLFIWLVWDFWWRNGQLRQRPAIEAWRVRSGDACDLRGVADGLEGSLVAWLVSGAFYNQIFMVHWLYTILTLNLLLHRLTRPERGAPATPPPRR